MEKLVGKWRQALIIPISKGEREGVKLMAVFNNSYVGSFGFCFATVMINIRSNHIHPRQQLIFNISYSCAQPNSRTGRVGFLDLKLIKLAEK